MDDTGSVNRNGPYGDGLICASSQRATAAWPIDDDRGWPQVTAVTALGAAGRRPRTTRRHDQVVVSSAPRVATVGELGADRSARLQTRDDEPSSSSSGVDELLGGETRSRTQVREVTFRSARPNAHQRGRVGDRSASRDVGGKDVQLAPGC